MVSLGDFNSMLSQDDKYNGAHISSYEVSDFKECCTDLGLSNLNSTGCLFTWSHGHVWSKLDRVMANPFWFSMSHQAHVHFGTPSTFSDHSPASIQIGTRPVSRNMWADHPQFLEIISQNWNSHINSSPIFIFYTKLKCLKRLLKELNKLYYSHISERVAHTKEELASHQSLLHQNHDNIHLLQQERKLRSSLLNLKSAKHLFFKQKLKLNFLKEVDKGSWFFHALMSQKH